MGIAERFRQPRMSTTMAHYRLPAEWEPVEAVLMAWPHPETDWVHMLPEVERCYVDIITAMVPYAHVLVIGPDIDAIGRALAHIPDDRLTILPCLTNDTWTRDYGPITVTDPNGGRIPLDFRFNAWGMKFAADHDNMATTALAAMGVFRTTPLNRRDFVLEGGSIESDGNGTILTTTRCLMSPNRNDTMGRADIEARLATELGAKRILWLEHGALDGDDTDSHIDTLARILPPGDVIAYTGCADPSDSQYYELRAMADSLRSFRTADGKPYHLLELPIPDAVHDPDDGHRLPATYANFLIVNDAVLLPVYGQPLKDRMAADILAAAMPDHTIVPVDCRALIRQHGSLHCATMQIPENTLSI